MATEQPTSVEVLIVEDERDLADAYAATLSDSYTVQTACSGEEALELVHPGTDVILLDRRMPGVSGDALLGELRTHDTEYQIAMVTAVLPDAEMLKLDIDEYLTKPVTGDDLHRVVGDLVRRSVLETGLQAYFAQLSKKQALERERSVDELISNSEYQQLLLDLATQRAAITDELARQASPRLRVEHHYSVGQILAGIVGIGLVVALLITVHFAVPEALERFQRLSDPTNPLLGYPATVLHLDETHLFGNITGFVLAAGLSYALCLWLVSVRWFYATAVGLFVVIPGAVYLLVYGALDPVLPGETSVLVGFSAVVFGFVGFSVLLALAALRLVYQPREVLLLAGVGLFSAVSVSVVIRTDESAVVPVGLAVLCVLLFARERYTHTESLRSAAFRHDLVVAGGIFLVYTGLAFGTLVSTEGASAYSAAGHLIGLLFGVVIAVVAAMAMNVFPLRETIQNRGYPLPDRLF